jgi:3-hydroxybutyryl-CoA dehydrogenase
MKINNNEIIGVVGLGLMGSSIVTSLLINNQKVIALSPMKSSLDSQAPDRVLTSLNECKEEGITQSKPEDLFKNVSFVDDYNELLKCWLVIECVYEDIDIKKNVLNKIEAVVSDDVIIASNTSSIPISLLQKYLKKPERFFGMHWAEPAYTTRFLEIICGSQSILEIGEKLYEITTEWGKEPTLVRRDIQGFITNRLMYALYREAFYLVENGYATIEDIDRTCKNDAGHWLTFCGPFRYMDLTGVHSYHAVMKNLFKDLSNQTTMPKLIDDIVNNGGKGISNRTGFYDYTDEEAIQWEKNFEKFSFDIDRLSRKYIIKTNGISPNNK